MVMSRYVAVCCIALAYGAASGQYTFVDLHPESNPFASYGEGCGGGSQVGRVIPTSSGIQWHAMLWRGPTSYVDLHPAGADASDAWAASRTQQVGYASFPRPYDPRAALWIGSAASYVDLHPSTNTESYAVDVENDVQVGYGKKHGELNHALMWRGTKDSCVDLNPAEFNRSVALGTDGVRQVGSGGVPYQPTHAVIWNGSPTSFIDLHPLVGYESTEARAIDGNEVVGVGRTGGSGSPYHALLWHGSSGSLVVLHPFSPLASAQSYAEDVSGDTQVGWTEVDGPPNIRHAVLWHGTASSVIDLHTLMPAGYSHSKALSIDRETGDIVGEAYHDSSGRWHAVMWRSNAPLEIAPTALSFFVGSLVSGNVASLGLSDDVKLVGKLDTLQTGAIPQLQIDVSADVPSFSATQVDLTVEASSSVPTVLTAQMFNYATGKWDTVLTKPCSGTDQSHTVSLTSSPSNYLSGGPIKTRVRFLKSVFVPFLQGAVGRIDRVHWAVNR